MSLRFISQTTDTEHGVSARGFVLDQQGGEAVPGVLWTPAGATGPRPLVLVGHGGGQSKTFVGVVGRARRLAAECGFAAVAIDAPAHGDRPPTDEQARLIGTLRAAAAAGEPVGSAVADLNAAMARWSVPEWRSTIDAVQRLDDVGVGPVGYWGVSMGAAIGIPLAVAEPRITACVFGLVGTTIASEYAAARVTVPVRFLLQWDDEVVPRAEALALFDAFGSTEKSLHANPGGHGRVPQAEIDETVRFLARQLSVAGPQSAQAKRITDSRPTTPQ